MIRTVFAILIILSSTSCKKKPAYDSFNEKDLDFVSYYSDAKKTIKFIDTSGVINSWRQTNYNRYFHELISIYGATGHFQEDYTVSYIPNSGSGELYISVTSASYGQPDKLSLSFYDYANEISIANLNQQSNSLVINGITYNKVYSFKLYMFTVSNKYDSASLLFNRDHGIIQMKYSNGRIVTRTD